MSDELHALLRGAMVRGIVHQVADGGETQTVDVETHHGVVRGGAEVAQPFGVASVPPDGAVAILLAVGGDQGDMVALLTAPGSRLGGLAPGEVAIYAADGSRVHVKAGGIIEILAATKVIIRAPAVEIEAPDGVTITGNLHVVGDITATGTITP